MELWHYTMLFLAVSTTAVLGFPTGAPEDACPNLMPAGHTTPANMVGDDPFPYYVNISYIGGSYIPGTNYTILLSGTDADTDFRGFLIQAQTVADGTAVGTFVVGGNDHQLRCSNTAATHTTRDEKTMVTLTWTAPPFETGPILFRSTFVDRYSSADGVNRFWAREPSEMVTEATLVMFNRSMYSVNEDAGPVQPVLVMSRSLPSETVVEVYNMNGTAFGGEDYASGPYSVIIPPNSTYIAFDITITDDEVPEDDENFTLTINSSSLPSGVMPGNTYQATVTILDDDTIFVMFNQSMYSVNEGAGVVRPVLVISKESATDTTVQVTSMDGSATGGEDYTSGPYSVTIMAGDTYASFDIAITNDTTFEADQDFMLAINQDMLDPGFRVRSPYQATVTIVNDDPQPPGDGATGIAASSVMILLLMSIITIAI